MSDPHPQYKKLSGRAASFLGITRLWMADDHLLSVTSTLGMEQYRRYFFRNIEALIAVRTSRRMVLNIFFVFLIAAIAGMGAMLSTTFITQQSKITCWVVTGCVAAPFLVAMLVNSLRGPTCTFWVQTMGKLEALGAPLRLSQAQKIVDQLSPDITRAQLSASGTQL